MTLVASRFRCFSDLGKAEMTEVFLDTWPDGVEGKPAARPWYRMLCVGLTPWRRLEEMAAFSWRRLAAQNPKQRSARQETRSSATSVVRVKLCFRTVTRARLRLMEPCVSSYVPKISMMLMLTVVSRLTILPSSEFFVEELEHRSLLRSQNGWLYSHGIGLQAHKCPAQVAAQDTALRTWCSWEPQIVAELAAVRA